MATQIAKQIANHQCRHSHITNGNMLADKIRAAKAAGVLNQGRRHSHSSTGAQSSNNSHDEEDEEGDEEGGRDEEDEGDEEDEEE